jgi:hypothetical protein
LILWDLALVFHTELISLIYMYNKWLVELFNNNNDDDDESA